MSGWTGSNDWKALSGTLLNDGTNQGIGAAPTIIAPYQPDKSDYAVEAKIQVQRTSGCCNNASFGITVRGTPTSDNWQGYRVASGYEWDGSVYNPTGLAIVGPGGSNDSLAKVTFSPETTERTYRVEVKGNMIRVFVNGGLAVQATDNRYLSGGQVGLYSTSVQLKVSSFKVIVL